MLLFSHFIRSQDSIVATNPSAEFSPLFTIGNTSISDNSVRTSIIAPSELSPTFWTNSTIDHIDLHAPTQSQHIHSQMFADEQPFHVEEHEYMLDQEFDWHNYMSPVFANYNIHLTNSSIASSPIFSQEDGFGGLTPSQPFTPLLSNITDRGEDLNSPLSIRYSQLFEGEINIDDIPSLTDSGEDDSSDDEDEENDQHWMDIFMNMVNQQVHQIQQQQHLQQQPVQQQPLQQQPQAQQRFRYIPDDRIVNNTHKKAYHKIDNFIDDQQHSSYFNCGQLDKECMHCGARYWKNETTSNNEYNRCCMKGSIKLPPLTEPTPTIKSLLWGTHNDSKMFISNSRKFNSALSFASIQMNEFDFATTSVPAFRISGNVYHRLGPLHHQQIQQPAFIQLYFLDSTNAEDPEGNAQQHNFFNLSAPQLLLLDILREDIRNNNAYYQTLLDLLTQHHLNLLNAGDGGVLPVYTIRIDESRQNRQVAIGHDGQYTAPAKGKCDFGVVVTGMEEESETSKGRVVVIRSIGGGTSFIPSNHSSYDPLSYVVTHCNGDLGWTYQTYPKWSFRDGIWEQQNKYVSAREYYAYRAQIRDKPTCAVMKDTLLYGGPLALQYWVDIYVKIEHDRLNYIRFNQAQLRAESYGGLMDAIETGQQNRAGVQVILPSSFTGGPRYQFQNYQDAMGIVRKHGKPTYFITMTCNPNWPEIEAALYASRGNDGDPEAQAPDTRTPGEKEAQKPYYRTDVVARVFKMKVEELLDDLVKKQVLGRHVAHTASIEFQKRGLPHIHILLIVHPEDTPRTTEDYDNVVCAEIPNPVANPTLHSIVTKNMIHTCGARCQDGTGRCTKRFPKILREDTIDPADSFPEYRRRNLHPFQNAHGITIDDR